MDELKLPLFRSLTNAQQTLIENSVQLSGKGLPCHVTAINAAPSGALITVQFDVNCVYTLPQVTVPLFGPEYIRYPIKIGDLGVVQAIDTSISYTSGQGGSPPNLENSESFTGSNANLEGLYFLPVGNATWVSVDPAQVTIYAPNGCTIRDTNSGAVIVLHPNGITCTVGPTNVSMDANSISMSAPTSITLTSETITLAAPSIVLDGQLSQGEGATSYAAHLKGPLTVDNDVTANGTSVHTHEHSGVQPGSGDTGPPI